MLSGLSIDSSEFNRIVDSLSDGIAIAKSGLVTYSNDVMDSFVGFPAVGHTPDECFGFPVTLLCSGKFGDYICVETDMRGTFGLTVLKRTEEGVVITFKPLSDILDLSRRARYLSTFDGKLRNNLTSAMMAVSMLMRSGCADPSEYRVFIHNCCKLLRLSGTVSMLSAESDEQAGFCLKTADVCSLLYSICRRISAPLNTMGIAIGLHSDKKRFICSLCEDWIERAVLNLISGAISRIKGGGRIRLILEEFDNLMLIDVCDTGTPIHFYGKSSDDADLACRDIVRRVVRAHDGSLVSTRYNSENHVVMAIPIVTPSEPLLSDGGGKVERFIPAEFIELSEAFDSELYDFASIPDKHDRKAAK